MMLRATMGYQASGLTLVRLRTLLSFVRYLGLKRCSDGASHVTHSVDRVNASKISLQIGCATKAQWEEKDDNGRD